MAAGFVPCSGAILILVFLPDQRHPLSGIVMPLAIAVGMGLACRRWGGEHTAPPAGRDPPAGRGLSPAAP